MDVLQQGIDISDRNRIKDWDRLRFAADFVILRATFGMEGFDRAFVDNYNKAYASGFEVGAYHYLMASNVGEALVEADRFYSFLKGRRFSYPVYAVFDDAPRYERMHKQNRTEIVQVFLDQLRAWGYVAGLYAPSHWLTTRFDPKALVPYEIWVGERAETLSYHGSYGLWQFTPRGVASGINDGPYDNPMGMNRAYVDYPKMMRDLGRNGFEILKK